MLGISAGSFVGSSLANSSKKAKQPGEKAFAGPAETFNETADDVKKNSQGLLYGNEKTSDAKLLDVVQGDELNNTASVDLSKVQMLLFTVVAVITYAAALFRWVSENAPNDLESFPQLSDGLLVILGVSHAGYLGNKAIDQTPGKLL